VELEERAALVFRHRILVQQQITLAAAVVVVQ
jgi:hypothetical protein